MFTSSMKKLALGVAASAIALGLIVGGVASKPANAEETYNPECFAPDARSKKVIQYPAKEGPYRLALANGFVGNSWRIQMIQSLKAWAARPENAKDIKELKVVSTGTDVAAQIAAIDNMIAAGFDAIFFIAVNPTAFEPVIKRAERAGVVLVPFDNVIDSDKVVIINEPQIPFEEVKAQYILDHMAEKKGKVLEVRGLPGNSVDRDRSIGMHNVFDKVPEIEVITVVGNWDDGTTQKVVTDALNTHGQFAAFVPQHGTTGLMNALIAANHPKVPIGGGGENGSLRMIKEGGWTSISRVQTPALSAVAAKAAVALLQGHPLPQLVGLPIPTLTTEDLVDGKTYFSNAPDNFQAGADIPACDIVLPLEELLQQSPDNT
ncbi:MAG: substrate-binding domain-containing protein [Alphaproteobacteria bacterium]